MKKNLANQDRIARVIIGFVLVGLYVIDTVGLLGLAGGLALIASGAVGWCAVYRLLGHSTCPARTES